MLFTTSIVLPGLELSRFTELQKHISGHLHFSYLSLVYAAGREKDWTGWYHAFMKEELAWMS